jgi:hypothetical protein
MVLDAFDAAGVAPKDRPVLTHCQVRLSYGYLSSEMCVHVFGEKKYTYSSLSFFVPFLCMPASCVAHKDLFQRTHILLLQVLGEDLISRMARGGVIASIILLFAAIITNINSSVLCAEGRQIFSRSS